MRFTHPLEHVLGSKTKVAILRYLSLTGLELNGRQIARAINISPPTVNRALAELVKEGVLTQRNVGRTYLYRLNDDNRLAAELVIPLFQKERDLLKRALSEVLDDVPSILSAILYGSLVRGEEEPFSDVDLLIVADDGVRARDVLEERAVNFLERYGNVLSLYILSLDEFRSLYQQRDELLREILAEGRVVAGQSPLELVHGAS
ncbi:MAG TPA: winged helix-turn-helix transcriptional regulator [Anaerolineae bacterium]|nr:winged helix-turn-helix transcriptional regulator [Anaerolineae bacterium]